MEPRPSSNRDYIAIGIVFYLGLCNVTGVMFTEGLVKWGLYCAYLPSPNSALRCIR